jgi:adenylyltransferase/sulfurtransferase
MLIRKEENFMPMPELVQLLNEAKKEVQEIGPDDLKRMQSAGEDFILLDVREPDEVSRGTINGAIAIPRGLVDVTIDRVTTDKNRKLVLYCAGGVRSVLAGWMLKKMGFRDVISLAGGYNGWVNSR